MKTKQFFLTSFISAIIGFLVGTIVGILLSMFLFNNPNKETEIINSTIILEKIQQQSFLITRTIMTNEDVTITIDKGSDWSNFWWGHEITAEATVQTDIGVDFSTMQTSDIEVDTNNKTITIDLPDSEVYNVSIEGPIEVSTKSGLLKLLFASDTNEDYNLALEQLTAQAENSVSENNDLFTDAQSSALSTIKAIVQDTGYTVRAK